MIRYLVLTLLLVVTSVVSPAYAEMQNTDTAILRGLDKVSARVQTFETGINQTVRFGKNLFIRVRACRKSDPVDPPESAAFLEVWQKDMDTDESHWIFSGWMFGSSPALSAMDHPVYDVWVIDCKNSSTTSASEEKPEETSAPDGESDDGITDEEEEELLDE